MSPFSFCNLFDDLVGVGIEVFDDGWEEGFEGGVVVALGFELLEEGGEVGGPDEASFVFGADGALGGLGTGGGGEVSDGADSDGGFVHHGLPGSVGLALHNLAEGREDSFAGGLELGQVAVDDGVAVGVAEFVDDGAHAVGEGGFAEQGGVGYYDAVEFGRAVGVLDAGAVVAAEEGGDDDEGGVGSRSEVAREPVESGFGFQEGLHLALGFGVEGGLLFEEGGEVGLLGEVAGEFAEFSGVVGGPAFVEGWRRRVEGEFFA